MLATNDQVTLNLT